MPDDTSATALPVTVGLTGISDRAISPAGDVDHYRFSGVAGRTYVAEVCSVSASLAGGEVSPAVADSGNVLGSDD